MTQQRYDLYIFKDRESNLVLARKVSTWTYLHVADIAGNIIKIIPQ
jgi:hypothetical protein